MPPADPQQFDTIILGAGAAGLMCAIEAGKRGKRVLVLEHNERIGKKILISGGGRCNFTNVHCRAENFPSSNPHFAKSALARYTPGDFISLVEKHRIPYHEKTLGQLFCDRSAHDITNMLETECRAADVKIVCHSRVREVSAGPEFVVRADSGEYRAAALVVATGGLSIPKIGATSFGYDLARQFGLEIIAPRPALVPVLFGSEDRQNFGELAGVSTEVIASAAAPQAAASRPKSHGTQFREKLLFTHRGLSGPAVLQASLYLKPGAALRIDLAPDDQLLPVDALGSSPAVRQPTTAELSVELRKILPKRLADRWLDRWLLRRHEQIADKHLWSAAALRDFERDLHEWVVQPAGDEGYAKAEVTAGGIDTSELNSTTMECKKIPGLYFIGEVVDVTGQLGGYNFQWAWASGAAAGRAV